MSLPDIISDNAISALLALLLPVGLAWFRKSKAAAYEKMFLAGVEIAYLMVNDLAKKSPNKVDDKVALALKFLADFLKSNGQELKPEYAERAKMMWSAMHGGGR